jgi:hypothetical protein
MIGSRARAGERLRRINIGNIVCAGSGLGNRHRLVRLLSWRNQVDALYYKTGSPDFERRDLRLSSGFVVRF